MTNRLLITALLLLLPAGLRAGGGFSPDNASALLRTLSVDIGPRPMGSPAERAAMEFAVRKLAEYGCDTAYVMAMDRTSSANTSSGIAVGIRKGKTGRTIVLGGHIDSSSPEIPGANDDGSGCAVVLEAARILCARENESTIVFALFGGEEQGLEGSRYFVDHYAGLDSVVLMLQVDMANGLGTLLMDPDTYGASAPGWLVRAAVEEFDRLGYSGLEYPLHYFTLNYAFPVGSASDHGPFLSAGIPAVDFTTDVGDPIHTPQDTYANFDPAGLKRTGDLILALTERFDGGVPSRETERYLLWLVFSWPLMLPYGALWTFLAFTIGFSLFTLFRLRRHHLLLRSREGYVEAKWPGLKIALVALLASTLAWMSPDIIGLIKGVRYPWFAHPSEYYLLGLIALLFGLLLGLSIVGRLRITASPYILYKRAAIALLLVTVPAAAANIEVAVFPAVCLLLITFSVTTGNFILSIPAAVLAPVGLFRLLFSEADELLFRSAAPHLPPGILPAVVLNGIWIAALAFLLTVGLAGIAAAVRWAEVSDRFTAAFRSRRFLVITGGLFCIYAAYLLLLPSYEKPWLPVVRITQVFDAEGEAGSMTVESPDYLDGANIVFDGTDTVLFGRTLEFRTPDSALPNPWWVRLLRNADAEESDSGIRYDVELTLAAPRRPYTVRVSLESPGGPPPAVRTPLRTKAGGSSTGITWYSFPEMPLSASYSVFVPAGDTVREKIVVTFDSLAVPVTVRYRQADFINRTEFRAGFTYRGRETGAGPGG